MEFDVYFINDYYLSLLYFVYMLNLPCLLYMKNFNFDNL